MCSATKKCVISEYDDATVLLIRKKFLLVMSYKKSKAQQSIDPFITKVAHTR